MRGCRLAEGSTADAPGAGPAPDADQRTAVILAGGAGTRLWPLSRAATPKHLLRLLDDKTLLRMAYDRARLVADDVIVITEASQLEAARAELPEVPDEGWLVEPARRGTAACLALAANLLPGDGLMVSLHADHLIPDTEAFARTATAALDWADETGMLVTLGLEPKAPATGFGYIRMGESLGDRGSERRPEARRAMEFVEKPPLEEAQRMVQSGEYLWNLGIFAWRNRAFLAQLGQTAPDTAAGAEVAAAALREGRSADYDSAYLALPDIAVDHAVMERTSDLLVVPASFSWSDVGSWADIADVLRTDGDGNATEGDVVVMDGGGNVVLGGRQAVSLVGVSDMVVVATPDAILVCPRDRVQEVKLLVAELRRRDRQDLL
ncbi:MAG TPA: sugar phosphate nucleotidyltransferase [Steroidobacteraceae bacterium]|nr:sugar phosphate nucleotidyltransferase [Steroidobacteraceae bacterium]